MRSSGSFQTDPLPILGPRSGIIQRSHSERELMATYRGRKTDICRTVGFDIWGRPAKSVTKRPYPNGQHGPNLKERRQSEYGEQLLAKQVIRRYYNMLEKQFRNTFAKAQRMSGNTSL